MLASCLMFDSEDLANWYLTELVRQPERDDLRHLRL